MRQLRLEGHRRGHLGPVQQPLLRLRQGLFAARLRAVRGQRLRHDRLRHRLHQYDDQHNDDRHLNYEYVIDIDYQYHNTELVLFRRAGDWGY